MRKFVMFGILFCLISCGANKKTPTIGDKVQFTSGCIENGTCTGIINNGKSLKRVVGEDGTYTYSLVDNKKAAVLILSYGRTVPEGLQDGQYKEEIIIEIPTGKMPQTIALDKASNAVFGRFCYCKGATGYYPIRAGHLSIEKQKGKWVGNISFQVTEVPQVWKEASFLIQ